MHPYSPVGVQYSLVGVISDIKFCTMAVSLDEVDVQLLTALQEDADRTNVELARLTGLSPAATLHRVRRLKESGVIRVIRADADPARPAVQPRVRRHDQVPAAGHRGGQRGRRDRLPAHRGRP